MKPRLRAIKMTLGACEPAPYGSFLQEDDKYIVLVGNRTLRRHPERFQEAWAEIRPKLLHKDHPDPESIPWVDTGNELMALYWNERFDTYLCPHFEDWRDSRVRYLRSRGKCRAAYILSQCDSEETLRVAIAEASNVRVPQWGSDASNLRGSLWAWEALKDLPSSF